MNTFLWGALAMSSWVAGLFFLHFWRESRERLFVYFVLAFWLLTANWALLALVEQPTETRHWVYVLRLAAFLILIAGIVDKNRRGR